MPPSVYEIYQRSKKTSDINVFTEWFARPLAAVLLRWIQATRITPNQLTLASALMCLGAAAYVAVAPFWSLPIWVFAAIFEASFVLDCADGQLARWRGVASPAGHLLDFLMDELKATLVYVAVAISVWQQQADSQWLLIGCLGGLCVATGTAITSFLRRPEIAGSSAWTPEGDPGQIERPQSLLGYPRAALEWIARHIIHYPQYIWLLALAGRLDLYLWIYGATCALYVAKSAAGLLWRFGRA